MTAKRLSLWLAVYLLGSIVLVSVVDPMGLGWISVAIVGAYVFVMAVVISYQIHA